MNHLIVVRGEESSAIVQMTLPAIRKYAERCDAKVSVSDNSLASILADASISDYDSVLCLNAAVHVREHTPDLFRKFSKANPTFAVVSDWWRHLNTGKPDAYDFDLGVLLCNRLALRHILSPERASWVSSGRGEKEDWQHFMFGSGLLITWLSHDYNRFFGRDFSHQPGNVHDAYILQIVNKPEDECLKILRGLQRTHP